MKHLLKTTWGSITLTISGTKWNAQAFGAVPRNVSDAMKRVEKTHPRPDSAMAFFLMKQCCKDTLLYTKTEP